jgi:hypothetical protein
MLVIDKLGVDGECPLPRADAFDLEIFLERWLGSGKSIMFRSEVGIERNVMFSESFRFFAKHRLTRTFVVG